MILVEGDKYACEQCIRGHRSSTCKHIKRRLVLVRSRGRPLTDSTRRIAIMAEQLPPGKVKVENAPSSRKSTKNHDSCCGNHNSDSDCDHGRRRTKCSCCARASLRAQRSCGSSCSKCSSSSPSTATSSSSSSSSSFNASASSQTSAGSCGCDSKNSVFILKASTRRVYNVDKSSLKLLDPVAEVPTKQVGLELIHNLSKMNHHGKPMCRSKNFKTGEILMDFHRPGVSSMGSCCGESRVSKPGQGNCRCCAAKKVGKLRKLQNNPLSFAPPQDIHPIKTEASSSVPSAQPTPEAQPYDLFLADFCSVPGTCTCDPDNCQCPNCTEHNVHAKTQKFTIEELFDQCNVSGVNSQPVDSSTVLADGITSSFSAPNNNVISFGQVGVQKVPLDTEAQINNSLTNLDRSILNGSSPDSTNDSVSECLCEPDECACYNCEAHGIVNGIRLSDGVRVSSLSEFPIDVQLAYSNAQAKEKAREEKVLQSQSHNNQINSIMSTDLVAPSSDQPLSSVPTTTSLPTTSSLANASSLAVPLTDPLQHPIFPDSSPKKQGMNEIMIEFPDFEEVCKCPDGHCTCSNCFKHGRIGNADIL